MNIYSWFGDVLFDFGWTGVIALASALGFLASGRVGSIGGGRQWQCCCARSIQRRSSCRSDRQCGFGVDLATSGQQRCGGCTWSNAQSQRVLGSGSRLIISGVRGEDPGGCGGIWLADVAPCLEAIVADSVVTRYIMDNSQDPELERWCAALAKRCSTSTRAATSASAAAAISIATAR